MDQITAFECYGMADSAERQGDDYGRDAWLAHGAEIGLIVRDACEVEFAAVKRIAELRAMPIAPAPSAEAIADGMLTWADETATCALKASLLGD